MQDNHALLCTGKLFFGVSRKLFLFGALALCTHCKSNTSRNETKPEFFPGGSYEESFRDKNTIVFFGEGISPESMAGRPQKQLIYARQSSRLNAEHKFRDICYGASIRPCGPKRQLEPDLAEALQRDLKAVKEKCEYVNPPTDRTACRIEYEFHFKDLKARCDAAGSEAGMDILAAGCGAW